MNFFLMSPEVFENAPRSQSWNFSWTHGRIAIPREPNLGTSRGLTVGSLYLREPNLGTSRGLTVGSLYLREPNRGTLCRLTVAPIYELSIDFVGTSYQICKTQTNIYMNICVSFVK